MMGQFEGLILSTARMYATQVRWDEDDMAQELRVKVWRALKRYDPTRSSVPLRNYVYGAIANRVKDFKRDAAREVNRQHRNGVSFCHLEAFDNRDGYDREEPLARFHSVDHYAVYGSIDEGTLTLPATLGDHEIKVLLLLMMEWSKPEIALRLAVSISQIHTIVGSLRRKLADWEPTLRQDSSQRVVVELALAA